MSGNILQNLSHGLQSAVSSARVKAMHWLQFQDAAANDAADGTCGTSSSGSYSDEEAATRKRSDGEKSKQQLRELISRNAFGASDLIDGEYDNPTEFDGNATAEEPEVEDDVQEQKDHLSRFRRGTSGISRYLFSDEGQGKGAVKVYIQGSDLDAGVGESIAHLGLCGRAATPGAFHEVEVAFRPRSLHVRAVTQDGRGWSLNVVLFDYVCEQECRWRLSSGGDKVSITLKKRRPQISWHQLTAASGPMITESNFI